MYINQWALSLTFCDSVGMQVFDVLLIYMQWTHIASTTNAVYYAPLIFFPFQIQLPLGRSCSLLKRLLAVAVKEQQCSSKRTKIKWIRIGMGKDGGREYSNQLYNQTLMQLARISVLFGGNFKRGQKYLRQSER